MSHHLKLVGGTGLKSPPRRTTTWFADPPGFGLRTYASGWRSYVVQTRISGRLRTVTIAKADFVSEAEARRLARHLVMAAQTGGDPADDRKTARASPAFADFLNEYWRRKEPRWKPSTRTTNAIYRRGYLDGAFAGKFVDGIVEADILRWFSDTTDRAGPGGANRVLDILNAMFLCAEAWGYRAEGSNPCRGVRRNRQRRFQRFLGVAELQRLGRVLGEERGRRPEHAAAVLLLLLTGCRMSEITGLRWADVRGHKLLLRDSKTGPRTVWVGEDARSVLDGLRRHPKIEWVFFNWSRRKQIRFLGDFWRDVRTVAGLPSVRLHDLRHTFASHAASLSETLPMIGKLLGHAKVASTARYAHLDDADVLDAAERVGNAIEGMMA
jgi:integrase